jgi:hypothetical protein
MAWPPGLLVAPPCPPPAGCVDSPGAISPAVLQQLERLWRRPASSPPPAEGKVRDERSCQLEKVHTRGGRHHASTGIAVDGAAEVQPSEPDWATFAQSGDH